MQTRQMLSSFLRQWLKLPISNLTWFRYFHHYSIECEVIAPTLPYTFKWLTNSLSTKMTPHMPLRYKYQTFEFDQIDIHLKKLRNKQEFEDAEGLAASLGICSAAWPIFGVVWPSSIILAHHLHHMDLRDLHVLEIGCGIGLPSILLNHMNVEITATDYHPAVCQFLDANTRLNNDKKIPFSRIEWKNLETQLGTFDLIIGSDLLYEDNHINELSTFIDKHAKPACKVILVDPDRGRKTKFRKRMQACSFDWAEVPTISSVWLDEPFKGHILTFTRKI